MAQIKDKRVAALVATTIVFVAVNGCIWLGVLDSFTSPLQPKPYRVKNMHDYNAIFVDESTLFLVEKKPYHGSLRLGEEEVSNINQFTDRCVYCKDTCPYNTTVLTIPLSRSNSITLTIYDFHKCRLPTRCVWYERYFSCADLLSISAFTA